MSSAPRRKGRKKIPDSERLAVWVRCGGRCAICNKYLLEGGMTFREVSLGELAHIVGQQKTDGSPRGLADLAPVDRDHADNLMLICADEHDEIDDRDTLDVFTIDRLRALKHAHEDRIRYVTGLAEDRSTTVLRLVAQVRGNEVELSRETIASTVISSAQRFPRFLESYSRHGFEIDLRHLPDEAQADQEYYRAAKKAIDQVVDHRLNEGIAGDQVAHLSVFGFARIPLLVYLGSRLDDNVPTDVYQRHRDTESWIWSSEAPTVEFSVETINETASGPDAVLLLNVSGAIQISEIPAPLAGLHTYRLAPTGFEVGQDALRSKASLKNFTTSIRRMFSHIEMTDKHILRLHVLAAVPVSAAVTLGRIRIPEVNPALVLYDRTDQGTYQTAMEIQ